MEDEGWEMSSGEKAIFESEYLQARPGDHLMTAFQCDLCHFRNLQKRSPCPERDTDRWLLMCIRRASLDAFWGSRPGTVAGHVKEMKTVLKIADQLGIEYPFKDHPRGPFPIADTVGMFKAVAMLQRSFDPGRNSTTVQWSTCRKIRSCVSNAIHTSPMGSGLASMTDGQKTTHFTSSPTNHVWFQSFAKGFKNRLGEVVLQDQALTIDDLLAFLIALDERWVAGKSRQDWEDLFEVATIGTAVACGFSAGLRGEELGHIRVQQSLLKTSTGMDHPRKKHMVLALQGRFKGVDGTRAHHIPLVPESASGIRNYKWFSRLILVLKHYGIESGPLLRKSPTNREPARVVDLDPLFLEGLQDIKTKPRGNSLTAIESVEAFSLRRSLRRGSTAQARNMKVPQDVIYLHNRWRKPGAQQGGSIMETYTDTSAAIEALLLYSEAL